VTIPAPALAGAHTAVAAQGAFVEGGLSVRGHLFVLVATAGALGYVLRLVRRRRMGGRYALLWSAVALVLVVLAAWPGLLTLLSELVGVHYPPALFLLALSGLLFLVVVHLSYELTRLEDRSRILAEEIALLRAEQEQGDSPDRPAPTTPGPDRPAHRDE
jgi:hypothetical protein